MVGRTNTKKKKPDEKEKKTENKSNPRLTGEIGTMVKPSGGYDEKAHALTAREIAEYRRKRKAKKKG